MDIDLHIIEKTTQLLQENIRMNLCALGLGNSFLAMTPKAQVTKRIMQVTKKRQTGIHKN